MPTLSLRSLGFAVCVPALLCLLFPGPMAAQERTGEVLKELITAVERDVTAMETKVQNFAQERQAFLQAWQDKRTALEQVRDALELENLRVDLLTLNARLNRLEARQVGAYLDTIARIMPKLRQLKDELRHGGTLKLQEDVRVYQRKVGRFMTNAANLLRTLRQTGPASGRREIAALEHTLVGILEHLESPLQGSAAEIGQIDRIIKELDEAYAQFVTVRRLLEQERVALKAENYAAIARLTLIRLGYGALNTRSIAGAASRMRQGIIDRAKATRKWRRRSPVFAGDPQDRPGPFSPQDREALRRIQQGQYQWNRD